MKRLQILLAITVTIISCHGSPKPIKTGLEGKLIPSFKLLLVDSSTYFDTKEIPNGKPVVLFYFEPYCPYSQAQMDEIIKKIETLNDIRFYIFTAWPYADMKKFYSHFQLNKFSNITTGIDPSHSFSKYFNPPGVPYLAIFGKDKKLIDAFVGSLHSEVIKKESTN